MSLHASGTYSARLPSCPKGSAEVVPVLEGDDPWGVLAGRLSPSGRHHAMSHEAFHLLLALRSADLERVRGSAAELRRLSGDRGFPQTYGAVEALGQALASAHGSVAPEVQHACVLLIRTMVRDGLVNNAVAPGVRRRD